MISTKEKLLQLLITNNVPQEEIISALYGDILETILGAICDFAKLSKENWLYIKHEFEKYDNNLATQRVAKYITGFNLSTEETNWLCSCLEAFLRKRPRNQAKANNARKNLWLVQNKKCAFCGKEISLSESHVDHIIPYDYVGDELENNFQVLCTSCNSSKSNKVGIALKQMILNHGGKK